MDRLTSDYIEPERQSFRCMPLLTLSMHSFPLKVLISLFLLPYSNKILVKKGKLEEKKKRIESQALLQSILSKLITILYFIANIDMCIVSL
jgi:hypothetical protein